jgi:F-type H+-transporting ATPase subunit b
VTPRARRALLLGAAGAVSLFLALPTLASEGGAEETYLWIPTIGWKIINFLFFFGVLAYLLSRPLQHLFTSRREGIAKELEEAERLKIEATRLTTETEQRVAGLEAEIAGLRERLRLEGERERDALQRQGETEAARLIAQVQQEADRRVAVARTELAREAAQTAAEVARELLAKELTQEDRDRIFLRTVARLTGPGGGQP